MFNLENNIDYTTSAINQIDALIAEHEKNIKYLELFDGQKLAVAMLRNAITALKQIRAKVVQDQSTGVRKQGPVKKIEDYFPPKINPIIPAPWPNYPGNGWEPKYFLGRAPGTGDVYAYTESRSSKTE